MNLTNLIPGVSEIKLALAGVLAAALLSGLGWVVWEYKDLQHLKAANVILTTNNKTLQENNDIIKENLQKLESANATDQATITSLIKERDQAQQAIATLAAQQKSSTATIGVLGKKLDEMKKNAANDGPIAPDLRETIRGIQDSEK